jgi:hypothetical protein
MRAPYTVPWLHPAAHTTLRARWITAHAVLMPGLLLTLFLLPVTLPCALAVTQMRLLRPSMGRGWSWGGATLLGVALGYALGGWAWIELNKQSVIPILPGVIIGMSVFGACVGLPQWWVLRRAGGQSTWRWPLASAIGWVGVGLAAVIGTQEPLDLRAVLILLMGVLYGGATGPVLARIVQHLPAPTPPAETR